MYFRSLRDDTSGELSYLIADDRSREAVLVDPRPSDVSLLSALIAEQQLALRWVLRTHHHDDQNSTDWTALNSLGAKIVQSDAHASSYTPENHEKLSFGFEFIQVIYSPGHTAHCLSFLWRDRLFCGGLLDVSQCPHQPFAAEPALLWDTRQQLLKLPIETLLFSGHAKDSCSISSLMDQRRMNPFFGSLSRDEFLKSMGSIRTNALQPQ